MYNVMATPTPPPNRPKAGDSGEGSESRNADPVQREGSSLSLALG